MYSVARTHAHIQAYENLDTTIISISAGNILETEEKSAASFILPLI